MTFGTSSTRMWKLTGEAGVPVRLLSAPAGPQRPLLLRTLSPGTAQGPSYASGATLRLGPDSFLVADTSAAPVWPQNM